MRTKDSKRLYLVIAALSTLLLFLGSLHFEIGKPYTDKYYPKQLNSSVEQSVYDDLKVSTYLENRLSENPAWKNTSIIVSIYSSQSEETFFKVNHAEFVVEEKKEKLSRKVLIEMKDIKKSSTNIFFVETSCATERTSKNHKHSESFALNARQCCAVESTALMNLDRDVYIFHSCPLSDDFIAQSPKFVKKLLLYPNVRVVRFNNHEIFYGSPVHQLFENKKLETSVYPIEHTSDVFRFVLLWKFGGTYCDLDVVTIRSFHNLKTNWVGLESADTIASAVMNFEPEGTAHRMLKRALEHLNKHFDGVNWISNGPALITQAVLRECNVTRALETIENCQAGLTVFRSNILFPLYYSESPKLFNEMIGKSIIKQVKSKSYTVHIWNKISHEMKGKVGSNQAYSILAEEFCPGVYQNCGEYF